MDLDITGTQVIFVTLVRLGRERHHVDDRAGVAHRVAIERDVAEPQHLHEQQQRRAERTKL